MLDLTRLMRRAGRVLTGVDRVELAYARALLADPVPVFGLIRARLGYILLDQNGMVDLLPSLSGSVGSSDAQISTAWEVARRASVGRVPPFLLRRMLRRRVPQGFAYVNVGHSNLTPRVLDSVKAVGASCAVMIHDVIPLDFPEYQREGSVPAFAEMVARVEAYADVVIYNSEHTREQTEARFATLPKAIVAHLGTDVVRPEPDTLPAGLPPNAPYFVCIGTIEPRKNHAFLLDIWEQIGPDAPSLVLAGSRGWRNKDVFDRLDRLADDVLIQEVHGLDDGALAALVQRSSGVLFPSHAEGFGLPATEAAALGVPLIVNDLAVFREILGDIPIYASVSDRYLWISKIKELAEADPDTPRPPQFQPPTWDAHFKIVLRLT
ncbi:glycosyltransferase family 1 protein [uncultured Tateyamaria sp.]|uniref:glycosyltransferase family 4 protein n=1 Tax=uncultured Tateyamaria sp. TaxID=455651 RepID=UPI0026038A85|nr:glycosyltransferase family 1 protein [uncultured Tateyamaria sp.]